MRRLMALLVGVGSLVIAGAAGAEQTYTDGSGDSGTAPDLTQVVVSNDATQVTFRIAAPGRTPTDTEAHVLFIDSDANASTGDDGDELRAIFAFPSFNWNASSSGVLTGFEVWTIAPSFTIAKNTIGHSGTFGDHSEMTSPFLMPRAARPAAVCRICSSSDP